jgi:hypothetical protein
LSQRPCLTMELPKHLRKPSLFRKKKRSLDDRRKTGQIRNRAT